MLAVLSAVLLASTLVLPDVKGPQTVQQTVPPWDSSSLNNQIFGYGIPPVVQGSVINVTLSGFEPRQINYALFPTVGDVYLQPLAADRVGGGPSYSFAAIAQESYSLELMITAYNGSGYTIRYSGVWASFDFLLVYTTPAVFLFIASIAATYYFGTKIPRQLAEDRVHAELEEERKRGGAEQ